MLLDLRNIVETAPPSQHFQLTIDARNRISETIFCIFRIRLTLREIRCHLYTGFHWCRFNALLCNCSEKVFFCSYLFQWYLEISWKKWLKMKKNCQVFLPKFHRSYVSMHKFRVDILEEQSFGDTSYVKN